MLLPYYIVALNIEHAYYERTNEYKPFEGICFADTLNLEGQQMELFSEKYTGWETVFPASYWSIPLFRADAPSFRLKNCRPFALFTTKEETMQ